MQRAEGRRHFVHCGGRKVDVDGEGEACYGMEALGSGCLVLYLAAKKVAYNTRLRLATVRLPRGRKSRNGNINHNDKRMLRIRDLLIH